MTPAWITRRLLLLIGAGGLCACSPRSVDTAPPRTASEVPTAADAAPPALPLTGRGVIVPSDVKLEPPPNRPPETRDPALTTPVAGPGSN